jgi:leucyl-tRNA---protein transferase
MHSVLSFLTPLSSCEYRPDQLSQLRYAYDVQLQPDDYAVRLRQGWRRFGYAVFQPECPSCRRCQSLRLPVHAFRAAASQRRAWNRNDGVVTLRIGEPSASRGKRELWARFHEHGQRAKGWPAVQSTDLKPFIENPFPTEEWSYYLADRLIAVGYVDALADALSAIYFYYDPAERHRSLGTFNILSLIEAARQRGLPHVYLGYYVEGCRSLEYKARFRPNEVLRDGRWVSLAT